MELVDFNVVVFVIIDLVENLLQSQASLFKNFYQVIENLVLSLNLLSFRVQSLYFIFVLCPVECLKFSKLHDAVFIGINFLEQRPDFQRFQAQVEVFA